MRFDLNRLGSFSFERIVRALCFKELGTGGIVYSPGPDGARDFTIDGIIRGYEQQQWSGYLVVQAKFCESPRGGVDDVNWLISQLTRELDKYLDTKRQLKRPEYYIVATNIALSGADGAGPNRNSIGGHTKVTNELEKWKAQIGLKGFDIWTADKLSDLLANASDIRRAYAALITAGDVFSQLLVQSYSSSSRFPELIQRALKTALRRDQFVRLKDAGTVTDLKIRTSQVFIDLPVGFAIHAKSQGSATARVRRGQELFVAQLANTCREKFGQHFEEGAEAKEVTGLPRRPNRIVLLGGPGQGKSTVGLFAAQLFRAALLQADPRTTDDDTVSGLVQELLRRAQSEKIGEHLPLRYPVHVFLPRFADAITKAKQSDKHSPSLLAQIASDLTILADSEIDKEDLRKWLKEYPWLVILDGLDEVPPSGERSSVLEAITGFISEVAELRADTVVIVTTRPQGYNSDLSPEHWNHWLLTGLPPDRALRYAAEFSLAQYPDDKDRRERIVSRLQEAAAKPATAHLMVSPLQVTIMHTIVDSGGSVPTARWTLFNEYFEILKRREKAKEGPIHKYIEANLPYLGPIHQRTGLVLQVESERSGRATSGLEHNRFRNLVTGYLSSEGLRGAQLEQRISELMEAAFQRLVLISTRDEGRVSFEVRSLQEFTAASALSAGNPKAFEERLKHISGRVHWQHVFLIAASRCFSDDTFHYLRSSIVQIARYLDTQPLDSLVRSGARLALEMFEDGLGKDHPAFRRELAVHALDLLKLGVSEFDDRMRLLWEDETADVVSQICRENLLSGGSELALATWRLLLCATLSQRADVQALVSQLWPSDPDVALAIVANAEPPLPTDEFVERFCNILLRNSPGKVVQHCLKLFDRLPANVTSKETVDHSPLRRLALGTIGRERYEGVSVFKDEASNHFMAEYHALPETPLGVESQLPLPTWPLLDRVDLFVREPSKAHMASVLAEAATDDIMYVHELVPLMPWPIAGLFASARESKDLLKFANDAKAGQFGDRSDWVAAQTRWRAHGVVEADLLVGAGGAWFDKRIALVGAPIFSLIYNDVSLSNRAAYKLTTIAERYEPGRLKTIYLALIEQLIEQTNQGPYEAGETVQILELFVVATGTAPLNCLEIVTNELFVNERVVSIVSDIASRSNIDWVNMPNISVGACCETLSRFPTCRGLLRLVLTGLLYDPDMEAIKKLPRETFNPRAGDSPLVQIARIVLLTLVQDEAPNDDELEALGQAISQSVEIGIALVSDALKLDFVKPELIHRMLIALVTYSRTVGTIPEAALRDWLRQSLSRQKSDLADRDVWSALQLPSDSYEILDQRAIG